jgi:hypothetical protein
MKILKNKTYKLKTVDLGFQARIIGTRQTLTRFTVGLDCVKEMLLTGDYISVEMSGPRVAEPFIFIPVCQVQSFILEPEITNE